MSETWIWGRHAVEATVLTRPHDVFEVLVAEGSRSVDRFRELLAGGAVPVRVVPRYRVDAIATGTHNGVAARIRAEPAPGGTLAALLEVGPVGERVLFALDQVEDPRNLGALLRTAAAFGVGGVVTTSVRSAPLSGEALKAASGTAELVSLVRVPNLRAAIDEMRRSGFRALGADTQGEPCDKVDLAGDVVIVLGGEGSGLRRLTREGCDGLVSVPMVGPVESLNVSMAAAVLAYEARRQRRRGEVRHGY